MQITLISHKDEVVLVFDQSYQWVCFTPTEARAIALKLVEMADQLEGVKAPKSN